MREYRARFEELKGVIADRARRLKQGSARVLYNEMSSGGKYSPGTPIDTGFHRWHWDAAVGGAPSGGSAGSQAAADARVEAAVEAFGDAETLTVTNNGPAIRRLEFDSWSQQAPDGFVRPAAEAIQQIVDEVAVGLANE